MKAIVDASALLMMVKNLNERELLNKLNDLATLDLAVYEVGNGFWKWASLKSTVSRSEVKSLIQTMKNIFLLDGFTKISWRDLDYSSVFNLALDNNITFYDASYLMASIALKKPLVTEDEKLSQVATKYVRAVSWKSL